MSCGCYGINGSFRRFIWISSLSSTRHRVSGVLYLCWDHQTLNIRHQTWWRNPHMCEISPLVNQTHKWRLISLKCKKCMRIHFGKQQLVMLKRRWSAFMWNTAKYNNDVMKYGAKCSFEDRNYTWSHRFIIESVSIFRYYRKLKLLKYFCSIRSNKICLNNIQRHFWKK